MRTELTELFSIIAIWLVITAVMFIALAFMEKSFWLLMLGLSYIPGAFIVFDTVCKIKNERRK